MKRLLIFILGGMLFSCASPRLVSDISYRSIRNQDPVKHQINSLREIPATAEIAIATAISWKTETVEITVYNLTDSTMAIDRTQSFFIYPDRQVPYYDPSVTTHTKTTGTGRGASVNLGAIGSALGVGGVVGTALSGINVGGSRSSSNSTTTYDIDQQLIYIPPRGHATMLRKFDIKTILSGAGYAQGNNFFGVCIAYSKDRMKSLQNFISTYTMNNLLIVPVRKEKRNYYPNEALRSIYTANPDLFTEKWWCIDFRGDRSAFYGENPILFDYK